MAGNPNHLVTRALEAEWHKLLAIVLLEQGLTEIEITTEMIEHFMQAYPDGAVLADARGGRLVLRLVSAQEAERLARQEGGLAS